jgi:hypothetical protein
LNEQSVRHRGFEFNSETVYLKWSKLVLFCKVLAPSMTASWGVTALLTSVVALLYITGSLRILGEPFDVGQGLTSLVALSSILTLSYALTRHGIQELVRRGKVHAIGA